MTISAGAIRWDAWYNVAAPSFYAQRSLGPVEWQNRAPWFANAHPADNLIDCNGDRQLVMDLEIGYAAAAGLKFWAFTQYDPAAQSATLCTAWDLYQTSSLKDDINWCWIVTSNDLFGSTGNYDTQVAGYVANFKQSNYHKVLTDRPLLFLFATTFPSFGNSVANFAPAITALRAACASNDVADPYIVIMADPTTAYQMLQDVGADAISHYLGGIPLVAGATYDALMTTSRSYWNQYPTTGAEYIPTVQMGWDKRPRIQQPVPWSPNPSEYYTLPGTIAQRAQLLQDAIDFVGSHQSSCTTNTVIIYSWNECDEGGGGLMPTLGDPPTGPPPALNGILSAIAPIIT